MGAHVVNGGLVCDGLAAGAKTFIYAHYGDQSIDLRTALTDTQISDLVDAASVDQATFDATANGIASWYAGQSASMKACIRSGVSEFERAAGVL